MSLTIGVDPGLSGAVAVLDGDRLVTVFDMPNADGHVMCADFHGQLLTHIGIQWLCTDHAGNRFNPITAWVENVSSMPGQGVASTFKFGRSVGAVEGVLGALGIPIRWVTPAKWKGALGLSKDKAASRRRAMELWPDHAHLFARVKDDGRAEAALIAWYGARQA